MNDTRKRIAAMTAIGLVVGSRDGNDLPDRGRSGAGFKLLERLVVWSRGAAPGGGGGMSARLILLPRTRVGQAAKTIDEVFAVRFSAC